MAGCWKLSKHRYATNMLNVSSSASIRLSLISVVKMTARVVDYVQMHYCYQHYDVTNTLFFTNLKINLKEMFGLKNWPHQNWLLNWTLKIGFVECSEHWKPQTQKHRDVSSQHCSSKIDPIDASPV